MDRQTHWERIHREKAADAVSWYRPHLDVSLELIEQLAAERAASIIDVGAGQSTLAEDLLARGYRRLTVLDISQAAVDAGRRRLGERGGVVRWVAGDVTGIELEPAAFDVWHDRAVFHFLTSEADRAAYARQVSRALKPGGSAIVATFATDGPARCSGLDVVRYDAASLQQELGDAFQLVRAREEDHRTPGGSVQRFLYCCFRRAPVDPAAGSGRRL